MSFTITEIEMPTNVNLLRIPKRFTLLICSAPFLYPCVGLTGNMRHGRLIHDIRRRNPHPQLIFNRSHLLRVGFTSLDTNVELCDLDIASVII